MYIPSRNHDFKYSKSSIVLIERLILYSLNIYFTPENTRSSSEDIIGIENTSIAIIER